MSNNKSLDGYANPVEHYVAPFDEDDFSAPPDTSVGRRASKLRDIWVYLRRRFAFWFSVVVLFTLTLAALFPGLFTRVPPNSDCYLKNSNGGPTGEHILGFTKQGCDVFSRIVHGASTSLSVGLLTLAFALAIGVTIGALAGFFGGWVDAIISRAADIFFVIPFLVAAIVVMSAFSSFRSVFTIALVLAVFGWPGTARLVRSEVYRVKNLEFVLAAHCLGQRKWGILMKHIIPNSLSPIYSLAAISVGYAIISETVLSFLGLGLPSNVMSWGNDIASAQPDLRNNPMTLFWPSLVLSVTVLAFTLLGDVIRKANNPAERSKG
ncbi:ABC transporter permease [Tropheryma whipplei]|uniref:Dipeptide transport system permease protein n=1 Tax=Tropheryma whipplei (strain Twist) TaxID=203267 RepID=Q83N23_TROWT|nr:ABC transporter permease [Tropheryma whipplei]AAO44238.1 dipeptide transport system permease protein [Tropheryma whipplei str. Twist]MCO8182890.1 ABC transporter permease [Tropheryma whipplei]MCO8190448.1 ABC transporter permease [Tropheryma whipplei]CAD66830.1 putative ABC transporter system integral membrane subunit [Tropheryma whipplei TW08/27]